jgi:hypothetical protein
MQSRLICAQSYCLNKALHISPYSAIWPWQHLSADSLDAQGAEQPDLVTAVGDRRAVLTGTDRRFMLSKVIHVGIGGGRSRCDSAATRSFFLATSSCRDVRPPG